MIFRTYQNLSGEIYLHVVIWRFVFILGFRR
jgi:hypothetical protein